MMVSDLAKFAGLLIASQCLTTSATSFSAPRDTATRNLVAATHRSYQRPRSDAIELYHSAELIYADRHALHEGQSFAAKVSVTSERPILVLEDFEHLLSNVACDSNTLTLVRPSSSGLWPRDSFNDLVNGHIITSHYGCNTQHARRPYQVLEVTSASEDAVTFGIMPVTFRDSFDTFKIEMGYTDDVHEVRPHHPAGQRHWARQATATVATGVPSAVPFNDSIVPSIADPAPMPSSSATLYGFDLAGSLIDKSLGPFETPAGTVPVEIGCVNCTTFGTVDVTFASFDWTCGVHPDTENIGSCLQGGANITTHGLGAHMEMSANLSNSFSFEVPLSQLQAKFRIRIPEIGSAGVVFGNVLAGGYEMEGNIGMTYGFDLTVPDGSNIMLDVIDPEDSSISGFQDAKVTALPVQTSVDIQNLNLYIALRAIVKATFEFQEHFEMSGEFGAGVYVDLPVLSANITPVTNVDVSCQPLSAAALSSTPGLNVSTSAISVDFSAGVDFGAFVKAEATILGQAFAKDDHDVNLKKTIPIGAGCFEFKNNSVSTVGAAGTVGSTSSHKNSSSPPLAIRQAVPLSLGLFLVASIFLTL